MLLYERLIGPGHPRHPSLASMREDFAAAALVVVDNAARFYFESPQQEWHLARHFPNVAPPWPKAFFEYRGPRFINLGGRSSPAAWPTHDGGQSVSLRTTVTLELPQGQAQLFVNEY